MAIIKIIPPYKGNGSSNDANPEMKVTIRKTKSGAEYDLILKRKHIEVIPKKGIPNPNKHGQDIIVDWYADTGLDEQEKIQAFAIIMDHYRNRSLGDNGFRGASIGVATDSTKGQSRLFIGTNTTRWASPYFKDCAEQNMVNAATDTLAFEAVNVGKPPEPATFKAIYIMQGVNEGMRDGKKHDGVPIACACGKCTDMLARVMSSPTAPVITIPLLTEPLRKTIQDKRDVVVINETAQTIADITPPKKNHHRCEVWKTSLEKLNCDREMTLDAPAAEMQKVAFDRVVKIAASPFGLPEDRAANSRQTIATWAKKHGQAPATIAELVNLIAHHIKTKAVKLSDSITALGKPAEQAAKNELRQRKSEASLDCAVREDDSIDLGGVNRFMVEQIRNTIADRLHTKGKNKLATTTATASQQWVREHIKYIRCAVIQLDDGTFRYAIQAEGELDNAMPNAEVVALENAVASLGRYGVRRAWVMEMNPDDINHGRMHTSPKEGVERLAKRASVEGLDFTFIPFNEGKLEHAEVATIAIKRSKEALYPAGHNGYLAATGQNHSKARSAPAAWQAFMIADQAGKGAGRS
ncbi:MAG: hypothetical protein V4735_09890 [Pseudomonadota bacterium]